MSSLELPRVPQIQRPRCHSSPSISQSFHLSLSRSYHPRLNIYTHQSLNINQGLNTLPQHSPNIYRSMFLSHSITPRLSHNMPQRLNTCRNNSI